MDFDTILLHICITSVAAAMGFAGLAFFLVTLQEFLKKFKENRER